MLVVVMPSPVYFTGAQAFAAVLDTTPRIVAASLTAYLMSSMIDVEIFAAWKERVGRYLIKMAVTFLSLPLIYATKYVHDGPDSP